MNDQERLKDLLARLSAIEGLDQSRFDRLIAELQRLDSAVGYDDTGRLKVAMFDARSYDIRSFEQSNNGRFSIHPIEASLSRDTVHAAAGFMVACIFVNDCCDASVVEAFASLGVKLIALRCAGFNNVDLSACSKHDISVVRVPAYSPYAVAEHSVALMLTLNRKLHHAYARNRAGYFVLDGLTGFDMRGKTVGVVGTGKIGQCLVDILLGFGCHVLAFDKFPNQELAAREGVSYVELNQLLSQSDIISLHVPLFADTHHLIDASAIEQMKRRVMIVNTSRGGLIDTRALIEGLKSGKIGSAGLDVYEEEAGIFFHNMSDKVLTDDVLARLMTFNNVVVTSHQAYLTDEALANIADTTLANIEEFAGGKRGHELTNLVQI
jgi:D-lactate dehydrogenase